MSFYGQLVLPCGDISATNDQTVNATGGMCNTDLDSVIDVDSVSLSGLAGPTWVSYPNDLQSISAVRDTDYNQLDGLDPINSTTAIRTNHFTLDDYDENSSLWGTTMASHLGLDCLTTDRAPSYATVSNESFHTNTINDASDMNLDTLQGRHSLVAVSSTKQGLTEEEWNLHKNQITQLYKTKKLPEVMRFMKDNHHFIASTKMYKSRIKKWGIDTKHNKDVEMRAAFRKLRQRADSGHPVTKFRIRGQLKDTQDIERYWNRKPVSIDDILAQGPPTPPGVECWTPLPSPITTPRDLAGAEDILHAIREYIQDSLEARTWTTDDTGTLIDVRDQVRNGYNELCSMNDHLCAARQLIRKGAYAGQALVASMRGVKTIISNEDPQTIQILLESVIELVAANLLDIGYSVVKHFYEMGRTLGLSPRHPLLRTLGQLLTLDSSQLEEVLCILLVSFADGIESGVGPSHRSAVVAHRTYVEVHRRRWDVDRSRSEYRKIYERCAAHYGPRHEISLNARIDLGFEMCDRADSNAAKDIALDVVSICSGVAERTWNYREALHILSESYHYLGEYALAEGYLRECIQICARDWGSQHSVTIFHLVMLEHRLEEWGKPDAAVKVRDKRIKAQESYELL